MLCFKVYYESLGRKHLNPDGKRKSRKIAAYEKYKNERLSIARRHIFQIKEKLKRFGYKLKSNEYSYTQRRYRIVGLEKPDTYYYDNGKTVEKYYVSLINLAHEYGHVLQWDNSSDNQYMFDYFYDKKYKNKENANDEKYIKQINLESDMFYELDAWKRAKEFVPKEIFWLFKKIMKDSLDTYKRECLLYSVNFRKNIYIIELAKKLNYSLL